MIKLRVSYFGICCCSKVLAFSPLPGENGGRRVSNAGFP